MLQSLWKKFPPRHETALKERFREGKAKQGRLQPKEPSQGSCLESGSIPLLSNLDDETSQRVEDFVIIFLCLAPVKGGVSFFWGVEDDRGGEGGSGETRAPWHREVFAIELRMHQLRRNSKHSSRFVVSRVPTVLTKYLQDEIMRVAPSVDDKRANA